MKVRCVKTYDPCYGFSIIKPGQEFDVSFDGNAFWSLSGGFGYLDIGEYSKYFEMVLEPQREIAGYNPSNGEPVYC